MSAVDLALLRALPALKALNLDLAPEDTHQSWEGGWAELKASCAAAS